MNDEIRQHVGLAVDGGGVRGAMVCYGLIELERKFGLTEGQSLIQDGRFEVLAGTSTGALITGSLAIGMRAEEILELYRRMGAVVFGQPGKLRPFGRSVPLITHLGMPVPVFKALSKLPLGLNDLVFYTLLPARYSFEPLRAVIREILQEKLPENPDPTMKELGEIMRDRYPHAPTLVITGAEVGNRHTRFMKTTPDSDYCHVKFVDALLASSCIPTYFPPVNLPNEDGTKSDRWLVDGGVGNFGNPASVVAWELCDIRNPDTRRRYNPNTVSLFSFGTGYTPRDDYRKNYGSPTNWWAMQWVQRSIDMFMADAIREQSRNIVTHYAGIDLRRFQVASAKGVSADEFNMIDMYLKDLGLILQERVRDNRHALNDPSADPEGIQHSTIEEFVEA
ncbi:MAG: patatin-like phospholipase family protein [Chloroflexi bacterium]|nr:patatin-like phospholipase family protein [Chloroflexota bacterium]